MEPPRTASNEAPDTDNESETDGYNTQDDTKTEEISPRTNLKETVFFFPDLKTDADGNVIFSFTMNEALTKWKSQGFAHTKELAAGMLKKDIITQKDLMVVPNPPRFFREGDKITFSAKVVNLSEKDLSGTVKLDLYDALSGKDVNEKLGKQELELPFQIKAGSSESFSWPLEIPSKGV
ncbi:MAG: alpha-2-macroglobulin family protein [Saprospiraceae bacterium]